MESTNPTPHTNTTNKQTFSQIKEKIDKLKSKKPNKILDEIESCLIAMDIDDQKSQPINEEDEEEKLFEWSMCTDKENIPPHEAKNNKSPKMKNHISERFLCENVQSVSLKKKSKIIETEFLYENMKEIDSIVLMTISKINSVESSVPYDQIKVDDPRLIDYFLSEFLGIEKKYKKTLTGKKLKADRVYIPPMPSEVIDRHKKLNKNFKVNFHHNPAPTGRPQTGYCYRVVCDKLKMNDFYKVDDREKLPSCKLREYLSQKILKILYPTLTTWVELLEFLKFKI